MCSRSVSSVCVELSSCRVGGVDSDHHRFLGSNLPEITVVLQLFQHYFGITEKSRKNRIFHRFFDFSP